MAKHACLLLLIGLAPIWPAMAQQKPLDVPTRDVTATYRLEGGPPGAGQQTMTMAYQVAGEKMRIGQANQGFTIMDGQARRTYVVNIPQRAYFEVPYDPADRSFIPPGMTFTRGGTDTVAGLTCTIWQTREANQTSSACITADGLMLRAEEPGPNGQTQKIAATSVQYGPPPAGTFRVPAGYKQVQPPPPPGEMPPGQMPGAPPGQQ